jgi:hypothetical protein
MQEAECRLIRLAEARPEELRLFQQDEGSLNIGSDKRAGRGNGTVHVALRRKMNDCARLMFAQQTTYEFGVADVAMSKAITRISIQCRQVGWISRVSEQVEVHHRRARGSDPIQDEIRAYEAGPACNQYRIQVQFLRTSVYAAESVAWRMESNRIVGFLDRAPKGTSAAGQVFVIFYRVSFAHTRPGLLRQNHSRETMAIFLDGHRAVDVSFRPINAFCTEKTH